MGESSHNNHIVIGHASMVFTSHGKQPQIKAVIGLNWRSLMTAVGHVDDEGMYNFEKIPPSFGKQIRSWSGLFEQDFHCYFCNWNTLIIILNTEIIIWDNLHTSMG